MNIEYLVELNAQLKKAQEQVTSAQLRWDYLMEQHRLFSALTDDGIVSNASRVNSGSSEGPNSSALLLSSASSSSSGCCFRLRYGLERLWIRHLRYFTFRFGAVLTGTLSVFVVLGEVTLAAPINLSPISWILHAFDDYGSSILFQIAALVPLLCECSLSGFQFLQQILSHFLWSIKDMSICVYTCLFQMSLLGPYRLRGNRQSHGVALVFNAQFLVRLQFPLAYNFLLM
jgi:hypothetical protein